MLAVSYAVALAAMLAATLYLFLRLRLFITTTTMLIGSLLLIYGPAFLSYTLSSGEPNFVIHRLSYGDFTSPVVAHLIFAIIKAKISVFDTVIATMIFSIALMYVGIFARIEAVVRLL